MPPGPVMLPPDGGVTVSTGALVGRLATTTVVEAVTPTPYRNVPRALTRYRPAVAHWWLTRGPSPVRPSPKSQCTAVGGRPSAPAASRFTGSPTNGLLLDTDSCRYGPGTGCGGSLPAGDGPVPGCCGCCGWFPGGPCWPSPVPAPVGFPGSYLRTGWYPPSRWMTPARSLFGSLKNTSPSRVSNWNCVCGRSTWGWLTTRPCRRSTIHTWPVV